MKHNSITDVPGVEVGQAQNEEALTGCTVILCRKGAVGGVDVRGGAPGTRETDLLSPLNLVQKVHAVVLAGGSAFGLDAASGVMRFLEENKIGFNAGAAKVPIVPSAILFDLGLGRADIRPDAEMGYRAASSATTNPPREGNAGAGTGASVGKIRGPGNAMKSGIGSASVEIGGGVIVGALIAVNPFGDVVDPNNGQIVAGARKSRKTKPGDSNYFADTIKTMTSFYGRTVMKFAGHANTVIGAVATNAKLDKAQANKVAQMAHNGIARTVRPAHSMMDGDTIFALSTGKRGADVSTVGAYAAEMVAQAILRAAHMAASAGGLPGLADTVK
ncbi:MAG: putative aminopeptidase [Anaerolineales bacterium]|nr:putative aminopeptidase [Anaerolineales bacterium]